MKYIMILVLALCLTGCNAPKKVSPAEFQRLVECVPQTMHYCEFLGVRDGNAVMKVSSMSLSNQKKWSDQYYFTGAAELPMEWLAEQLKKADAKGKNNSEHFR